MSTNQRLMVHNNQSEAGVPDTHVSQGVHDVVLHGGVVAVVQDLTECRDDLLGLLLILKTHLTQADH